MRGLTSNDLLVAWEQGQGERPLERALTLLAPACPGHGREELAGLPLGRRDALLLSLRERTFGDVMHALADCPACGATLELSLRTAECRVPAGAPPESFEVAAGDVTLRLRLPGSDDLAALPGGADPAAALRALLGRCTLGATREGAEVPCPELSPELVERIGARMAEEDGQADLRLAMRCSGCDHEFASRLDVAAFLWAEVSAQARRLLGEVHTLARAYGWREADILAMSAARRRLYLEMVGP